jgi:tripartite motif-containing protein 71
MTRSRTVAILLALAALAAACKKSETPGGTGGETGPKGAAATPAQDVGGEPKLSEKAEPGAAPYAPMKITHDFALDDRGRLYATDFKSNRIRVFDAAGASFGGWGTTGTGKYGFKDPASVAVSGDDVYVCDTWNGRVQRYSLAGAWKGVVAGFYGPGGVAAGAGHVAVSDTGRNQVVIFDTDLKNEVRVGKLGKEPGDFSGPVGLAISPSGNIFVADVGNHRVQVLTAAGKPKASWTVPGWKAWCMASVETDGDETVYASDCSGDSVWALNASGKLVRTINAADDGTKLIAPAGLAVDRKARVLYVGHEGDPPIVKVKIGQ